MQPILRRWNANASPSASCFHSLSQQGFSRLQSGLIDNLTISSGFFQDELKARIYSKVRRLLCIHCMIAGGVLGAAQTLSASVPAASVPGAADPLHKHGRVSLRRRTSVNSPLQTNSTFKLTPPQVILMDHVDWLEDSAARDLAATLAQQVGVPAAMKGAAAKGKRRVGQPAGRRGVPPS